jgi:hypothetical protein
MQAQTGQALNIAAAARELATLAVQQRDETASALRTLQEENCELQAQLDEADPWGMEESIYEQISDEMIQNICELMEIENHYQSSMVAAIYRLISKLQGGDDMSIDEVALMRQLLAINEVQLLEERKRREEILRQREEQRTRGQNG